MFQLFSGKRKETENQSLISSGEKLFSNSPFTLKILRSVNDVEFDGIKIGLHGYAFGSYMMLNLAFLCTPIYYPFYGIGQTGSGKTDQAWIALKLWELNGEHLEGNEHKVVYKDDGVTTMASLALMSTLYDKIIDNNSDKKDSIKDIEKDMALLRKAEVAFWEDLSKGTDYGKKDTPVVLTSMSEKDVISYRTAGTVNSKSGGKVNIGKKKRVLYFSTLYDYALISSSSQWTEYMSRRNTVGNLWLFPEEWDARLKFAMELENPLDDDEIVKIWYNTITKNYNFKKYPILITNDRHKMKISESARKIRQLCKRYVIGMKVIPEGSVKVIDTIAFGHALFNSRTEVLEDDYDFYMNIARRFIDFYDISGKNALVFNQFCRCAKMNSNNVYETTEEKLEEEMRKLYAEVSRIEQQRSRGREEIKSIIYSKPSIEKYLEPYLIAKYVENENSKHPHTVIRAVNKITETTQNWYNMLRKLKLIS